MRDPLHPPMGGAHDAHGLLDLRHGPVGGGRHVGRGAGEPAQRVLPIAGMVRHAGHHLRVRRLDEQGADAADEAGGVAHDLPGDGVGAEEAGVARVVHGVGHGVVGVREEAHGAAHDGAPQAVEGTGRTGGGRRHAAHCIGRCHPVARPGRWTGGVACILGLANGGPARARRSAERRERAPDGWTSDGRRAAGRALRVRARAHRGGQRPGAGLLPTPRDAGRPLQGHPGRRQRGGRRGRAAHPWAASRSASRATPSWARSRAAQTWRAPAASGSSTPSTARSPSSATSPPGASPSASSTRAASRWASWRRPRAMRSSWAGAAMAPR